MDTSMVIDSNPASRLPINPSLGSPTRGAATARIAGVPRALVAATILVLLVAFSGHVAFALAALGPHQPETLLPNLDVEFAQEGGKEPTPHEVLLYAALVGDSTRFTRQDDVEETWRIMQALLDAPPPVHSYAPGSWSPLKAADELVAGHGRWHGPWVTA
jgi:glucose-6-phosphate 1-dehydrogenase